MTANKIDYSSLKGLPVSKSCIDEIITRNLYYVDKTPYIKSVFKEENADAFLIARPRRFGKSLAMDTFYNFLKINPENPGDTSFQDQLFKNTAIYKDREFCKEFMGQYPVVLLSLKEVRGLHFENAYGRLAIEISDLAKNYTYLLDSPKLSTAEKDEFDVIQRDNLLLADKTLGVLGGALNRLTNFLYKHFGRKVIVLIDEYDVPIAQGYANGYHNEIVELIRSVLASTLKDNTAMFKGVLTGCLRVSKESIFTGFNNFKVNSVTNDFGELAECMGFTKQEVKTLLGYYGLSKYEQAVKDWYDGYRIGGSEIFCPWDVISYCDDATGRTKRDLPIPAPQSFWTATGTNNVIREFMPYLDKEEAERMQTLYDGGQITFQLNELLNYNEIGDSHHANDFWTLLLYTGYLTSVKNDKLDAQNTACTVRIPNRELRVAFKNCIVEYYSKSEIVKANSDDFISALLNGDPRSVLSLLKDKLSNFVSISDFENKAKPENFYQGFFSGIFSSSSKQFQNFKSNSPAGNGYADLTFTSKDLKTGVVIELKSTKDEGLLYDLAETALEQINSKKYFEEFKRNYVEKVYCYGIAFCRRTCDVRFEIKTL